MRISLSISVYTLDSLDEDFRKLELNFLLGSLFAEGGSRSRCPTGLLLDEWSTAWSSALCPGEGMLMATEEVDGAGCSKADKFSTRVCTGLPALGAATGWC